MLPSEDFIFKYCKTEIFCRQKYCHEWSLLGDLTFNWVFGTTQDEARNKASCNKAIATQQNKVWQDRSLGFGDWSVVMTVYENGNGHLCLKVTELLRHGLVVAFYRVEFPVCDAPGGSS
jgi:hypothetical protein